MLYEREDDPANEADDDTPTHLELVDSDSDERTIQGEGSASSSDDDDDREAEEQLLDTILAQAARAACPRANIKAEYGQRLYLSEISGDESPSQRKIAAIRKGGSKMKSPRFAEWAIIIIIYNPDEEFVCTTANDKSTDYYDDPSQDKVSTVLCEAKIELTNTDLLPDTQMVKESTLPFPR